VTAAAGASAGSWLACQVGTHVCALPLSGVVETMRPLPVETFVRAPAFVMGLAIIRGQPTPVVDVGLVMGGAVTLRNRFVTVRVNARVVALAFDDVLGIYSFSPSQTMELPPLLKEVAGETVSQVTTRDAELLLFFESARLFPTDLLETLVEKQMTG